MPQHPAAGPGGSLTAPATSARRRAAISASLPGAVEPLDARLLAHRRAAVGHRARHHELDGQARGRVAARPAGAVARQAALHVGAPARVERAVAAAQHVHPRLGHRAARRGRAASRRRRPRAPTARAPCSSRGRRTGVACIVRRRTSRQESPSFKQRGQAHDQRGRELDRLQHDPVGDRFGRGDVVGAGEHRHAGGLEDADVRGRGRDHGGDVDREQHRRGRAGAGLAVEPERHQQQPAGQPLQRPGAQLRERSRASAARGSRNTERPRRRRSSGAAKPARARACSAPEARDGRRRHEHGRGEHGEQRGERRQREQHQVAVVSLEHADARERDDAEHAQREQVQQRLGDHRAEHHRQRLARAAEAARDDQGARGLAEARGQRRGHQHADERALHRVAPFRPPPGRRRREDRVPADRAREHRRAHQRQRRRRAGRAWRRRATPPRA